MASNSDVIHNFIHKTGKKRNGLSVFYEDNTLYSYGHHFPMAKFTGKFTKEGKEILLLNTYRYSVTTAGHTSQTWHAVDRKKYHVISSNIQNRYYITELINDSFLNAAIANINYIAKRQSKAIKSEYLSDFLNEVSTIKELRKYRLASFSSNLYRKFLRLEKKLLPQIETKIQAIRTRQAEIEPLRKENARKRRIAKVKKLKKDMRQGLKELRRDGDFLKIKTVCNLLNIRKDFLVPTDSGFITSQGVKISNIEALLFANAIDKGKAVGFKVDGIFEVYRANGRFDIGCHSFSRAEIMRAKRKLEAVNV